MSLYGETNFKEDTQRNINVIARKVLISHLPKDSKLSKLENWYSYQLIRKDFYRQPKNSFIFHYPKPFYKIRLNHIGLSPGCLSWKEEFRRLYFLAPWNGINAENNAAEAQGSMKWFSDYAGKNEQYDPRCPETISNAHYGKVLQFTLNFNLTCRSSFTLMIVFLKNLCC